MEKKLLKGLIIATCLFGMVSTGFAIPLSFTFSGVINEGVIWDLNLDNNHPQTIANDISGLDFTMTLTQLPTAPFFDVYGFNMVMDVPGYSFDQPGGEFYEADFGMRVQETGIQTDPTYAFSLWGLSDSIFNATLDTNGIGLISQAYIGISQGQTHRVGAYLFENTEIIWSIHDDDNVPVPEPSSALLFSIGTIGLSAVYGFTKKPKK